MCSATRTDPHVGAWGIHRTLPSTLVEYAGSDCALGAHTPEDMGGQSSSLRSAGEEHRQAEGRGGGVKQGSEGMAVTVEVWTLS